MRTYPIFLFFLALLPAPASAGDGLLEPAARLARSGAPQLALARVERDQPAQANSPQWLQWEALRLSLLVELKRDQEALQRAAQLPPEIPAESRVLYVSAAQAALRLNDPTLARGYLAKWLWTGEHIPLPAPLPRAGEGDSVSLRDLRITDEQQKDARRMVIRSYLAQRRPDAAYLAMLRFQQDYQSLAAAEVAQFVEQLLLAGGLKEAGNWLAQLDDASALKLLLRLKSGLVLPEAAIAEARAALDPPPPPATLEVKKSSGKKVLKTAPALPARPAGKELAAYWSIIAQAAGQLKDPALQAAALERQLNLPAAPEDGLFGADAESLRRIYAELALTAANQAHLLVGEDAAWFDLAMRAVTTSPLTARALFSHLAPRNAESQVSVAAKTNLAALLLENNLDVAAMRLFAADAHFPAANPTVRAALGEIALRNQAYPLAAKYWRGVDAPPADMPPIEWQLKRAQAFALGGLPDEALGAVRRIYAEGLPLDQKSTAAILQIAYALDGRRHTGAEALLQQLATFADSGYWSEIYTALGRIAEGRGDYAQAADYYLQAAQWSEGATARRQAADCLVRAGLKEDARRQYALLLKAAKTPAERESLKQALGRL